MNLTTQQKFLAMRALCNDVQIRMGKLKTATPYGLQLLAYHAGKKYYEKQIHGLFAELRVNREWFWPHAKLCEWIYFRAEDGCQ